MRLLKTIYSLALILCLIALGVLVGTANNTKVPLKIMDWQSPDLQLSFWFLIFLFLGFIAGILASLTQMIKQSNRVRRIQSDLNAAKKEIGALHAQSLKASASPAAEAAES